MPTSHRWTIFDPETIATVTFPINPREVSYPPLEKQINGESTTAPGADGRPIFFEGADLPGRIGFNGAALDLTARQFFIDLWAHRHQVRLTDDFGDVYWIYPVKFAATRSRHRVSHPGYHTYTFEALILDWPS